MKTILNLSLVLMLIAGTAGAVDFYKMFKSGEIQTLYIDKTEANEVVPAHNCSAAASKPVIETLRENLVEIKLEPELYSRAPLTIKRKALVVNIEEPIEAATDTAPVFETVPQQAEAVAVVAPMVMEAPTATAIIKTRDEEAAIGNIKPVRKMKLKASMFSRGRIEEEFVREVDSVATSSVDTSSVR